MSVDDIRTTDSGRTIIGEDCEAVLYQVLHQQVPVQVPVLS